MSENNLTTLVPPKFLPEEFCAKGKEGSDYIYPPITSPDNMISTLDQGFPYLQEVKPTEGGAVVQRQEFNGFFRWLSQILSYMNYGGLFTFNAENINGYPKGALLWCESNKSFQYSLKDNNKANFVTNPSYINDGVNWSQVFQGNLNFTPVQQGGGAGQSANKVYIGWSPTDNALKAQVDITDLGIFPTQNNPGVFVKNNIVNIFTQQQAIGNNNDVILIPSTGLAGNVPACPTKFGIKLGWDGAHLRYMVNNDAGVTQPLVTLSEVPGLNNKSWQYINGFTNNVNYTNSHNYPVDVCVTCVATCTNATELSGAYIMINDNLSIISAYTPTTTAGSNVSCQFNFILPPGSRFQLLGINRTKFGYLIGTWLI